MSYWLDYSAAELSGTIIRNAGYAGAIRYIDSVANLGRKHTSLAEYRSIVAAGLGIRLVMQTTTSASDGGFTVGQDHARRALNGANYLGYGGVIYFTNDRTTVPNPAAWRGYLDGAISILGRARVGAYGFRNAMDLARGLVDHFWQAGRRSDVADFVQVWQDNNVQVTVGGITCDRNLILKPLTVEEPEVELKDPFVRADWNDKPGTVGHVIEGTRQLAESGRNEAVKATAAANAAKAAVAALDAKVSTPAPVNVDAAQVAALLGPVVAQQVADEVARRLAN